MLNRSYFFLKQQFVDRIWSLSILTGQKVKSKSQKSPKPTAKRKVENYFNNENRTSDFKVMKNLAINY